MKKILFTAFLFVLCLSGTEGAGDANCFRYPANALNPELCTADMRRDDHGDFKDFYTLFTDAHLNEHAQDSFGRLPTIIYTVQNAAPIIGRRKRANNFINDDALMVSKIRNICNSPGPGPACVQWLIGHFKDTAKEHFRQQNPQFPNASDYVTKVPPTDATTTTKKTTSTPTEPSTDTSTTTPMTTTATTTPMPTPAKTTPMPTTTTTTPMETTTTTTPMETTTTTTSVPTNSTNTPTTMTTSTPASPTTPSPADATPTTATPTTFGPPITCWQCSGLACLLGDKTDKCQPGEVCYISMFEGEHGRDIERGCVSLSTCASYNNSASCQDAEKMELSWHTRCSYCCDKDKCNHPPHIMPDDATTILHFP